jgi:hypothetical protein
VTNEYTTAEIPVPPPANRFRLLSRIEHSLSKSDCTLKGSARRLVGFSLLELLDDGFSRWRILNNPLSLYTSLLDTECLPDEYNGYSKFSDKRVLIFNEFMTWALAFKIWLQTALYRNQLVRTHVTNEYTTAEIPVPPPANRFRLLSRIEHSLSKSDCTLKGSARRLVGFSLLELLDDGFSRWRILNNPLSLYTSLLDTECLPDEYNGYSKFSDKRVLIFNEFMTWALAFKIN